MPFFPLEPLSPAPSDFDDRPIAPFSLDCDSSLGTLVLCQASPVFILLSPIGSQFSLPVQVQQSSGHLSPSSESTQEDQEQIEPQLTTHG